LFTKVSQSAECGGSFRISAILSFQVIFLSFLAARIGHLSRTPGGGFRPSSVSLSVTSGIVKGVVDDPLDASSVWPHDKSMLHDKRDRVLRLYAGGLRQAEIAQVMGVSRQRIHQIVRYSDKAAAVQPATKSKVYRLQVGLCSICRQSVAWSDAIFHHLRRRADGGTNDVHNLVMLCQPCHLAAHAKVIVN